MLMISLGAASRKITLIAATCFTPLFFPDRAVADDGTAVSNPVLGSLETALSDLVTRLGRSIVTIEVYPHVTAAPTGMLDHPVSTQPPMASIGTVISGVIVDSGGYILTSVPYEYVDGNFLVSFEGKRHAARLVGIDFVESVMLLQSPDLAGASASISQAQLCTGQMVLALGTAMGIRSTPSLGFCAGYRGDGTLQASTPYSDTYAGGALFDLSGRLYGLMNGRETTGSPFSLAVPAYRLRASVAYLKAHGDRDAGFLGMGGRTIRFGVQDDRTQLLTTGADPAGNGQGIRTGLLVNAVDPASPGAQAGILPGDVVTDFGTATISDQDAFSRAVRTMVPGTQVPMTIIRGEMVLTLNVQIGSRRETLHHALAQQGMATQHDAAAGTVASDSLLALFLGMQRQLDQLQQQLFHRQ